MLEGGEGVLPAAAVVPDDAIVEEGVVSDDEDVLFVEEEFDDANEDEVGVTGDHLAFFVSGPPVKSIGPR